MEKRNLNRITYDEMRDIENLSPYAGTIFLHREQGNFKNFQDLKKRLGNSLDEEVYQFIREKFFIS